MENDIIVFWREPYPEHFESSFGQHNIHLSLSEFSDSKIHEMNSLKGIIILCELNYNEKGESIKLQDFYGLKLAKEIRLRDVKTPILFTSFLSRKQIYSNKPEREIINTVGHDFIQLPVKPEMFIESLRNLNPLNSLELYDIQNSFCSKAGMVSELTHSLGDIKTKTNVDKKEVIIDIIMKISNIYNENPTELINEIEAISDTSANLDRLIRKVQAYGDKLISIYSPQSTIEINRENRNWKILWLDDEVSREHILIKKMKEFGIDVILFSDTLNAIEYLEDDWKGKNEIRVVIADYRLYEEKEGVKVHQKIQGYTFLKDIASSGHMIRLAALSHLPRKFLLYSFKNFNIKIDVFSKSDYLKDDNTIDLLCKELVQLGDENEEAIFSMPDYASGWKHLKDTYVLYRNCPEYTYIENKISDKAKKFATYYDSNGKFPEPIPFNKAPFNPGKNIEKTIEKFQHYWLGRRLAIWLGCIKNLSNKVIAETLKQKSCSDYKQVISQYLGLRIEDYPFGITIEEKNWLHYQMEVPIYEDFDYSKSILNKLQGLLIEYLKEIKVLNSKITLNDSHNFRLNYKAIADSLTTHQQYEFVNKVKSILYKEIVNVPKGIFLLRNYFLREHRKLLKALGLDDRSIRSQKNENKIKSYYDKICCGNLEYIEDYSKMTDDDKELFNDILSHSYNEEGELLDYSTMLNNYKNSLNPDDALEYVLEKEYDDSFSYSKVNKKSKKKKRF